MWVIAKNTFLETIRDRVLYAVVFFAVLMLCSSLLLSEISLFQDERIVRDIGLASISLFSVVITLFIGSKLIYKELEGRTILVVLSKPVLRSQLILGKWLGLSLVISCVTLLISLIFALICYAQGIPFSSLYIIAIAFGLLEHLVLIAAVMFFSTFLSPIITIFATLALYFVGHITDDLLEYVYISKNVLLQNISYALYFLLPNLDYFNLKTFAAYNISLPSEYFAWTTLYAAAWLFLLLFLASRIFARREF